MLTIAVLGLTVTTDTQQADRIATAVRVQTGRKCRASDTSTPTREQ
jgi:hypothetical protein